MLHRRSFIGSLGLLIAAPAIVRAASLMPVKAMTGNFYWEFMADSAWQRFEKFEFQIFHENKKFV